MPGAERWSVAATGRRDWSKGIVSAPDAANVGFPVIRSIRALLLFATVFWSYAVQWSVWRVSGRRVWDSRWERVHLRNAQRLASGFTRLRGVFIKFGQVVSVLAPFLPAAYGSVLEQLQDAVPPRRFSEIESRLIAAFGAAPAAAAAAALARSLAWVETEAEKREMN